MIDECHLPVAEYFRCLSLKYFCFPTVFAKRILASRRAPANSVNALYVLFLGAHFILVIFISASNIQKRIESIHGSIILLLNI